ncbi:MAG: sn-glycerol-3-phosphate ABC transporter ATP-binding protein UgpC [Candidatus Omnitrophica bacterium]|nr:sn-glycerol-3-phosphate ABC transporter ATP-binding protein UgpC [Candidatus Omnitrophota bacterium]
MAEVTFESVRKVFPGDVVAVDDFNLEIQDREFLILVGPSGCGKSTSLRMVAGLEEITGGQIKIGGKVVNDVPPKDRDIAMVFQNYALYPHMTVYKNMAFGLKLRKYPKDEIDKRVKEAAQILGIEELLHRKPKALSGGQRQRVAVGRAIVRKPKVFLFDEPLSNLDAKMRVQMRTEISKLHNRLQTTMIYVTHDQLEAMTMGDRIVVMKDGKILQVDDPITLYDHPSNLFVAGFIGTPPMNFLEGTLKSEGDQVFFHNDHLNVALDTNKINGGLSGYFGQKVIFGIRPEDIQDRQEVTEEIPNTSVKARVEVIEPVGSESVWYLSCGPASFVAKVNSHVKAEVNREKELVFNVSKAHLFDPLTENAIL